MRVISGLHKGRRFYPPANIPTRPTTDFAKTGLFNILNNYIDFADVSYLDLFAGTGSISYEFASRGCSDIVSVDANDKCVAFINKNKTDWKIEGMQVVRSDVFAFIKHCKRKFDIIFAGPPYPLENIDEIPEIIFTKGLLNENGWFIMETSPKHSYESNPNLFHVRNYGDTHFHFFRNAEAKNIAE